MQKDSLKFQALNSSKLENHKKWLRVRKLLLKQSQEHVVIWKGKSKIGYHLQRNNDLS